MYVVEVMGNDPDYVFSKRVIYIDATPVDKGGNFPLCWGEHFDQRGRLWKVSTMSSGVNKEGFKGPTYCIYANYQTDHYTLMDIYPAILGEREDFHKIYPLKEELFTISGLLKRAR